MARPRKKLDENQITGMAGQGSTVHEIAAVLDVSPDTIERRFAAAVKRGRLLHQRSLKRYLYELAQEKNLGAIVFSFKLFYGYREKQEVVTRDAKDEDTQKLLEEFKSLKGV